MQIDVLTLFPNLFISPLGESMMKRAQEKGKAVIRIHNIRDEARDKHKTCDDRPFGGGPGMVMKAEPIDRIARKLFGAPSKKKVHFISTSPGGKVFTQADAERLAKKKRLAILCGHYEGIDDRVRQMWVDEEISIGDYVLTGGELPALVMIDAVVRLLDGVLGNKDSKSFESFAGNLLEYPQYTRPEKYRGMSVPPVLLSGNHKAIEEWRHEMAVQRTQESRPDLLNQSKNHKKQRNSK